MKRVQSPKHTDRQRVRAKNSEASVKIPQSMEICIFTN